MDLKSLLERTKPLLLKNWLPLSLGILGMIFFAYGLIGLFAANKTSSEDIVFESNSAKQSPIEEKTILVDVEGSVVKQGVYKLPENSRIQDGLVAAGGLAATADRQYIAKNFNLAIKLTDGAKIYVPNVEEAVSGAEVLSASDTSSEGIVVGSLININTASESQLADGLSGVGAKTAQKIVAGRPYSAINELLSKKIVGAKVFEQIKEKITAY